MRNSETIQLQNEIAGYRIHYFSEARFNNDLQKVTLSEVLFMSSDNLMHLSLQENIDEYFHEQFE